ncbi:LysR substrate-binding domain-containing protein [Rhizobium sp. G21]|uniref:LysR substrate-binding domain-containing protein n=1 Tax=Rhizobium sp. G21 TaxID=2758439 RepID=UPI0028AA1D0B|nr:LysR substrate-binding domain-containing protein [Rhizobium sp. G21]
MRNVSLTEPDRRLAGGSCQQIGEIGMAIEELHEQAASPSGLVRINCDANAAEQVLMPLVTRFMKLQPAIRFDIRSEGKLVDIAEGGFDCGVRAAELVSEDMIAIPIGPDQQHIVVASPAYPDASPPLMTPKDLAIHECIQLRMASGSIYRWEFQRRCQDVVLSTTGNLVVDQSRLLLRAALEGCGLAYVTRWLARKLLLTERSGRCWRIGRHHILGFACTTRGIDISGRECVRFSTSWELRSHIRALERNRTTDSVQLVFGPRRFR